MSVQGPALQSSAQGLHKQLAKERRQRRLRRAMIAMSWTTPVLAFGGFFTIWHQLSTTPPSHSSKSTTSSTTASATGATTTATSNSPVVLAEGSTGHNVEILQYALAELGYFNHSLTTYYGPVTASAVKAFQQANHLPATGQLDEQTLNALQSDLNQASGRSGDDGGFGDDGGYGGSSAGSGTYGGTNGGSSGSSSGGSYFGSGSSSSGGATVSPPSTQPSVSSSAS